MILNIVFKIKFWIYTKNKILWIRSLFLEYECNNGKIFLE